MIDSKKRGHRLDQAMFDERLVGDDGRCRAQARLAQLLQKAQRRKFKLRHYRTNAEDGFVIVNCGERRQDRTMDRGRAWMAGDLRMLALAALLIIPTAAFADWHEGGTLKDTTMSEWFAATPENRLATAAELVVMFRNRPHQAFANIEDMRPHAEVLEHCIGETGKEPDAGPEPVLRIARLCAMLYRW